MELNRRGFLGRIATLGGALSVPCAWLTGKASPRRIVEAVRARWYPGAVRPLDPDAIRKPTSKWRG